MITRLVIIAMLALGMVQLGTLLNDIRTETIALRMLVQRQMERGG